MGGEYYSFVVEWYEGRPTVVMHEWPDFLTGRVRQIEEALELVLRGVRK